MKPTAGIQNQGLSEARLLQSGFPFYSWKCYFCLFHVSKKFQLCWSCWLLRPPTHAIFFNFHGPPRPGRGLRVPPGSGCLQTGPLVLRSHHALPRLRGRSCRSFPRPWL